MQDLYRGDRHRCAESILSESWREGPPKTLSLAEQEQYWGSLFNTPSVVDERPTSPVWEVKLG